MTTIRKSSAAMKLGKAIFSGAAMSPYAVADALRAAGLPIPKNRPVQVLVAQQLLGGGAMSDDLTRSLDILAICSGDQYGGLMDLLEQNGFFKEHPEMMQVMTLGSDVVMVISSSGANVLADLKLVTDVIAGLTPPNLGAEANHGAYIGLSNFMNRRRNMEIDALGVNFKDFHEGKLSVFGLMGKIAEESPDMFYNYFPGTQTFIPPGVLTMTGCYVSFSDSLFRGHEEYRACITSNPIVTVFKNDHAFIEQQIFNKYVAEPFEPYVRYSLYSEQESHVSIKTLALLSLFPPYVNIYPRNFNVMSLIQNLDLTPNDFDEPILQKYASQMSTQPSAGITFNGVDYLGTTSKLQAVGQETLNIRNYDKSGDLKNLLKSTKAREILKSWGNPIWPSYYLNGDGTPDLSRNSKPEETTLGIRTIRNYWSALSILDKIRSDSYFGDYGTQIDRYRYFGNIKGFEAKYKELNLKSYLRKINKNALKNVAMYLGTTPDKIVRVDKPELGKPAVYKVI